MDFLGEVRRDMTAVREHYAGLESRKEKTVYIVRLVLKLMLINGLSFSVVFGFSALFGPDSFAAGIVVLLCMQLFRISDLGMCRHHSILAVFCIFGIFAAGPPLAAMLDTAGAFGIHLACIFLLVLLGCHNVRRPNQAVLVLSYLLLAGFPVKEDPAGRTAALALGAVLTALGVWRRQSAHTETLRDVVRAFRLTSLRSRWQIRFAVGIASAMLLADIIDMIHPVWAGMAALPVMMPRAEEIRRRVLKRAVLNGVGCAVFLVLYFWLPEQFHALTAALGGLVIGIGASVSWTGMSGMVVPLSVAVAAVGFPMTVIYRIAHNFLAALYAWGADRALEKTMVGIAGRLRGRRDTGKDLAVVE